MCGRNSLFPPASELETRFDATIADGIEYVPRYNIAPGSSLEVVTSDRADEITHAHWGFLPRWAASFDNGMINARSETINDKSAFRDAWADRPCLVLSSGFYEWRRTDIGEKQPYRIHKPDEVAFSLAGIWNEVDVSSETIRSVAILTTEANGVVSSIHDRMPVILDRNEESRWLRAEPGERAHLCQPASSSELGAYPIDTRVNNPEHDDPRVIDPASRTQSGLDEFVDG